MTDTSVYKILPLNNSTLNKKSVGSCRPIIGSIVTCLLKFTPTQPLAKDANVGDDRGWVSSGKTCTVTSESTLVLSSYIINANPNHKLTPLEVVFFV